MKRPDIIEDNLLSLIDTTEHPLEYYGICPPPLNAQVALNELCEFFLGEDWYTTLSLHQEQVNTEIVYAIECMYKGDRKRGKRVSKYKKKKRKVKSKKCKLIIMENQKIL